MGELDIEDVYDKYYRQGEGEAESPYGGTTIQESLLSAHIVGRNVHDGVLQIYGVGLELDGIDEEPKPSSDRSLPLKLSARDEFDKYFSWNLDHNIGLSGEIQGKLVFDTSNGLVTYPVSFSKKG